jgi:hypothetical protein
MRIVITQHAIDRYIRRIDPAAAPADARAILETLARGAARLKEKTANGQSMWRSGDLVLVTKPDRGENVCVTVLHASQCWDKEENDAED